MDTRFATASDLCARIRAGELSSVEVLSDFIDAIEASDDTVNAVVARDFERALERAKAADQRRIRTSPGDLGPLEGLPLTVKESFNVAGLATTWGLESHRDNVANQDAEVVQRLSAAGAIVFGKTNVPTGVADHQTSNPLFGTTNNPWDVDLTCGGSSGGSAAALAAASPASRWAATLPDPYAYRRISAGFTVIGRLTAWFRRPATPFAARRRRPTSLP
jgi:amidase